MSCFDVLPRQPSQNMVILAWISGPNAKFGPGSPFFSTPMSPMRTPFTAPDSSKSASAAANPANTSTPSFSASAPRMGTSCPSEMIRLPWFIICGGVIGSLKRLRRVMNRNSSRVAGTQIAGACSRHDGSNSSSGPGSSTAPEREWAPRLAAFSRTQTLRSGFSCFRRMAQAKPAGPPPTIATSYSMTSRAISLIGMASKGLSSGGKRAVVDHKPPRPDDRDPPGGQAVRGFSQTRRFTQWGHHG